MGYLLLKLAPYVGNAPTQALRQRIYSASRVFNDIIRVIVLEILQ